MHWPDINSYLESGGPNMSPPRSHRPKETGAPSKLIKSGSANKDNELRGHCERSFLENSATPG